MQSNCISVKRAQRRRCALLGPVFAALALASCADGHGDDGHDHDNEVISRVVLTFTPTGGGEALTFQFDDPDGDGGVSGVADPIKLAVGVEYTLGLRFENGLVTPAEDLTGEIEAEAEEHLVFVVGDVAGPASTPSQALVTHAYADLESDYGDNAVGDDLPVGLRSTITGAAAGEGTLRLILRHLPEVNGEPQKSAGLPADLAAGRDLPGNVDVDLTFDLEVS